MRLLIFFVSQIKAYKYSTNTFSPYFDNLKGKFTEGIDDATKRDQ